MLYKKRGCLNMMDVNFFYKSKYINVYRIIHSQKEDGNVIGNTDSRSVYTGQMI